MVAEKFTMLIGAIFFVALASVIIVIISDAQQNLDIISNLGNASGTNITTGEEFLATDKILNGTPTLIRSTPDFSCTAFHLYYNATGDINDRRPITLTTGSSVVAGETEVLCVKNDKFSFNATHDDLAAGTIILILAGNSSNASADLGRGFNYTMSYTAKTFDANYNTSIVLQQQYLSGGDTQAQYFTLIILAILLSVGLGLLGVNMFRNNSSSGGKGFSGFGGGGGSKGGFMSSFER